MLIDSLPLWLGATNTYVIAPEAGGPAVVVDAPPDPEAIAGLVAKHRLIPTALLVTHGHIDHVGGAAAVAAGGITAYMHPDDDWLARDPMSQLLHLFGTAELGESAPLEHYSSLDDGQQLSLAGLSVEVVHTPGHTPGHCCFLVGDILFSGDQLFAGSIGRTDLPGGNEAALMDSMRHKILVLPDDTEVLPGHGPSTTLAAERRSNPFLQDLIE